MAPNYGLLIDIGYSLLGYWLFVIRLLVFRYLEKDATVSHILIFSEGNPKSFIFRLGSPAIYDAGKTI